MLTLAPHDLPNDEDRLPQHTITQANWKGETWEVGVGGTSSPNEYQFRSLVCQSSSSALLYFTPHATHGMSVMEEYTTADPFGLRMAFADCISNNNLARAFFLNEKFELRQRSEISRFFLILSPQGWGAWRNIDVDEIGTHGFYWSQVNSMDWLLSSPATQILEHITNLLSEQRSDVSFALSFANLQAWERRKMVWPCQRGDTSELERLLYCALLSHDQIWQHETNVVWDVNFDQKTRAISTLYNEEVEELIIPGLQSIALQVVNHFNPKRADELIQQHVCLQQVGRDYVQIEANLPSIHERLEAKLEWRDWLATHYPQAK